MSIEIMTPATREEWLALRRESLGASEVAALLGVHPFMSAYELWAARSGLLADDSSETAPMRRGRMLEAVAVDFLAEERPGWQVTANRIPGGKVYRDAERRISCTPDAFAVDPSRDGFATVQIKSVEPSIYRRQWKNDAGGVEPPLHVVVQAIQEARLTGASWAAVAPLVIGFGITMPIIDIPLHAGLMTRLDAEVAAFWRAVESGQPPAPDYGRDGAIIAALNPTDPDGPAIDLSSDNALPALIDERARLSASAKDADARRKAIDAEITMKLAGHPVGVLADGREITRTMQSRGAYAVEATSFPVIRVRSPKIRRNAA